MTLGDFEAANKAPLKLWTAATFRQDVGATLPVVAGVSSLLQALANEESAAENVATQQDPSKLLPSLNEVRNPVKITSTRAVYLLMCAAVHAVGTCRCRATLDCFNGLRTDHHHKLFE